MGCETRYFLNDYTQLTIFVAVEFKVVQDRGETTKPFC